MYRGSSFTISALGLKQAAKWGIQGGPSGLQLDIPSEFSPAEKDGAQNVIAIGPQPRGVQADPRSARWHFFLTTSWSLVRHCNSKRALLTKIFLDYGAGYVKGIWSSGYGIEMLSGKLYGQMLAIYI